MNALKWIFGSLMAMVLISAPMAAIAASPVGQAHCHQQTLIVANPPPGDYVVIHDNGCGTVVKVDPIYVF